MLPEEIVLPTTQPETEWVRGRPRAKVSPTRDHARVQSRLAAALDAWAGSRGEVGTEWRFRLAPPGEPRRPLVPDVAFVRVERLRARTHADIQAPEFPPDVAVEVLSPGEDVRDLDDKIDVYLRCGVELVLVVDTQTRALLAYDIEGAQRFSGCETFRHAALPEFALDLAPFFAAALDLPM